MHAGSAFELIDRSLDLALRRGLGQINTQRLNAHLGAVTMLARDIPLTARIAADQDRAQPRRHTPLTQRIHTHAELVLDRGRNRLAIENLRSHVIESHLV